MSLNFSSSRLTHSTMPLVLFAVSRRQSLRPSAVTINASCRSRFAHLLLLTGLLSRHLFLNWWHQKIDMALPSLVHTPRHQGRITRLMEPGELPLNIAVRSLDQEMYQVSRLLQTSQRKPLV